MKPHPEGKDGIWFIEEDSLFPVINYLVYRECHPLWRLKKRPVDRFDITYVIQGGARYTVDGLPYELQAGDLLCLEEGVIKEAVTYSKNPMHCFSVNFEIRNIQNQVIFPPFPRFSHIGMLPDLIQHFHDLVQISLIRQPGYMLKCTGLLLLILHRIYELTVLNIGENVKDVRIQDTIRYIVQHYAESLSVRHLANQLKLNSSYFGVIFKRETGESVHQYIAKIRIRNAKNILSAGGYRVSEVAEQCGYCDTYHFYKQFKAITGNPPSLYLPHRNE